MDGMSLSVDTAFLSKFHNPFLAELAERDLFFGNKKGTIPSSGLQALHHTVSLLKLLSTAPPLPATPGLQGGRQSP